MNAEKSSVAYLVAKQTVSDIVAKCLSEQDGIYTAESIAEEVESEIGDYNGKVFVPSREQLFSELIAAESRRGIRRKCNLKYIDKNGQADMLAFEQQAIALGDGQYITRKDAQLDAIKIRDNHRQDNIQKAIQHDLFESEAQKPVINYMIKNPGITFGQAARDIGLI